VSATSANPRGEAEAYVLAVHPYRERAAFVSRAGEIVHLREGTVEQVVWRESELLPLVGRVDLIVHNHPRGTSLSPADSVLAEYLGAHEVSAVTPEWRYRVVRRGPVWPPAQQLHDAVSSVEAALVAEYQTGLDAGDLIEEEAELLSYRELWQRVEWQFSGALR
jgi:hypothetical protein